MHVLYLIVGTNYALYRLFTAFLAFGSLYFVYKASGFIHKDKVFKLIVLLVFLVSPFISFVALELRPYSLLLLLYSVVFYLVLKMLITEKDLALADYISLLLVLILGSFVHIAFLWCIALLGFYFVLNFLFNRPLNYRLLIKYGVMPTVCVVIFILIINYLGVPVIFPQIKNSLNITNVARGTSDLGFLSLYSLSFFSLYTMTFNARIFVFVTFLLLLGFYSLFTNFRSNKSVVIYFITIFFAPVFFIFAKRIEVYQPYKYISFIFPHLVILFSLGFYEIFRILKLGRVIADILNKLQNVWYTSVLYILSALMFALVFIRVIATRHIITPSCYDLVFDYINQPNALILVNPPWEYLIMDVYNKDRYRIIGVNTLLHPEGANMTLNETLQYNWLPTTSTESINSLANYVKDDTSVYYINPAQYIGDPDLLALTWLKDHFLYEQLTWPCDKNPNNLFFKFNKAF